MLCLKWVIVVAGMSAALLVACGDDTEGQGGQGGAPACSPEAQTGCAEGLACEEVEGGEPACFAPVTLKGRVFDLATDAAIEGAHVVARDENQAAISPVAVTNPEGQFDLRVPAKRDANGAPIARAFTLRADAQDYLGFPKAPRVALPLDLADATGEPLVLQSTLSDIGLIALSETSDLGQISGSVNAELPGGALALAGGATGIADSDGSFTIFNVPAGEQTVSGYKQGLNLAAATATVAAGEETPNVVLTEIGAATARVSGSVQIVNGGGASTTSVILVLEDTFDETLARGETPPGLRAGDISGAFSIDGVPDGAYVVLAAFENDGLGRDPDTSIGGTEIAHITVAGADVEIDGGFKVTGALAVVSPGADGIEPVSGTPTFSWEDDSSEDLYRVEVFDALGNLTWETEGNFDPGGGDDATVEYGGPALETGMIYQFRATSIKDGVPISSTEDLKGVFISQ